LEQEFRHGTGLPAFGIQAGNTHIRIHEHDIVRRSTPAEFARHGVYVDEASLRSI
jgi:hypothetical protein